MLFTIAKRGKQPKGPSKDDEIRKTWYITQWNIIQPKEKKGASVWMSLEGVMPSEISQ